MKATVLGLNSLIEATYVVDSLQPGVVTAQEEHSVFAGKATTVARIVRLLGSNVALVLTVSAEAEAYLADLSDGCVQVVPVLVDGPLRTSLVVLERTSLRRLIVRSADRSQAPVFSEQEFIQAAEKASGDASIVAFSGSVPKSVGPTVVFESLLDAQSRGKQVLVDTSGPALTELAQVPDVVIKVNEREFQEAFGAPEIAEEQLAADVLAQGARAVIVTAGAKGARLYKAAGTWRVEVRRPLAACVSAGCGDAMMAGMIHALLQGDSLGTAVQFGAAIGVQSAGAVGSGRLAGVQDPLSLVGNLDRVPS